MTVKIKKLKKQPLLQPVQESKWWKITRDDEELMEERLEGWRTTSHHPVDVLNLGRLNALMVGAGVLDMVASEDEKTMRDALKTMRERKSGYQMTELLSLMKKCGFEFEATEEDMHLIQGEIDDQQRRGVGWAIIKLHCWATEAGIKIPLHPETEKTRGAESGRRDVKGAVKLLRRLKKNRLIEEAIGSRRKYRGDIQMVEMLHEMKTAGIIDEVQEKDEESIHRFMADTREKGNGLTLASAHYLMKELGVNEKITPQDKKVFKQAIKSARDQKHGYDIAELHYYMQNILPEAKKTGDTLESPPLKKFQK